MLLDHSTTGPRQSKKNYIYIMIARMKWGFDLTSKWPVVMIHMYLQLIIIIPWCCGIGKLYLLFLLSRLPTDLSN